MDISSKVLINVMSADILSSDVDIAFFAWRVLSKKKIVVNCFPKNIWYLHAHFRIAICIHTHNLYPQTFSLQSTKIFFITELAS